VYLNSLAIALPPHYKENGVIEILDEAIRLRREFVSFRPPGHRAGAISGLVKLYEIRFAITWDDADGEVIQALQWELDEYSDPHSDELGTDDEEDSSNAVDRLNFHVLLSPPAIPVLSSIVV
jgi:hypothetical protein